MTIEEISDKYDWTNWNPFPDPRKGSLLNAPKNKSGVYQLRNICSGEYVLFGISNNLQGRMKSILPAPYGTGTRNNSDKRDYVLEHIDDIEYRYVVTKNRETAAEIDREIKALKIHIFNT